MHLKSFVLAPQTLVTDIVKMDHRTADVFRKYGISYCCGGKWPLELMCNSLNLDTGVVIQELEKAMRSIPVSNQLDMTAWSPEFTMDYIVNIHHQYLKNSLLPLQELLTEFAAEHKSKFPYITDIELNHRKLTRHIFDILDKEENTLFTYIRHIAHAYKTKEPFGSLLLRTLRKPAEEIMSRSHLLLTDAVQSMRMLTDNYTPPPKACAIHVIVFAKLKELDLDIMHHIFLEQTILLPKVLQIEESFMNEQ